MNREDISNWGVFDTLGFDMKYLYVNGLHADHVSLLKNEKTGEKIIKKRYRAEHMDIFYNEVEHLYKLRDCPFVPKLLKVRADRRTMYMTYCGKGIGKEDYVKYSDLIGKYNQKLIGKWGVYHNDLKADNICIKRREIGPPRIYFIDFGWASDKKVKPGYKHRVPDIVRADSDNNDIDMVFMGKDLFREDDIENKSTVDFQIVDISEGSQ